MVARFGYMVNKWTVTAVAALALMAVVLATALPAWAQEGNEVEIDYAENGADPVATFTGLDPEGRTVHWSLATETVDLSDPANQDMTDPEDVRIADIADADDFSISDGVLSFKFPPDFETPTSSTVSGTLAAKNVYKVVVVASDDATGAAVDASNIDIRKKDYHKVTVTVTDVNEDGSITLSNQQPQMGVELNATLADQDATPVQITDAKWKWEQGTAMNGPWTVIVGDTADMETPVAGLVGKYLRATATYTDAHGDDKSAMAVSANAVRAVPPGTNASPVFPSSAGTRNVKENSPPGTNVGKPVAAGDAGDILTYTLSGDDDDSDYRIDRATGQITVGPRTMLDREDTDNDDFEHTVMVTATDPWGITDEGDTQSATIREVTITIGNVNEAPSITVGVTRSKQDENDDSVEGADGIQPPIISTYMATDLDANDTDTNRAWSVSGPDAGDFNISTAGVLRFKTNPNYEKPADADMDNAYMVTVVATDAGTSDERRIGVDKLTATRDVVITVMNADDMGTITLSSVQPKVGIDLVATLADEDGGVKDVKWQWYDDDIVETDFTTNAIAKATSATYTPVGGDDGDTLSVRATYTDAFGSTSATRTSTNVVVVDLANRAPEFKNANDQVITSDTRSVPENSPAGTSVGEAVTATDPNGTRDTLTYTLGERDASSFNIGSTDGQITVKAGTTLDYDGSKKSYTVTVTATDPSRATATITITINLTDVNEGPVIDGDEEVVRDFKENSGSTIHTFRATDPEGRPVYWSRSTEATDNEDVALFSISSTGALKFESPLPDYENPGDDGTNNSYKVIVEASDDAPGVGTPIESSMRKVIINVTNASESRSVSVNRRYAQVGVDVEATLTDGDATAAEIDAATWKWYTGTNTEVGTAATYSPTDTKTLNVEATYAAQGDTRTATKTGISVRAEPPADSDNDPAFPGPTEARSVDENKRAGTNVGKTIGATDLDSADRSRLTYSVAPDTHFSINNSGQLETKVPLDHETNPTLTVTVTATDPSDNAGTVTVTVTVNDVNEAPTILTGPTRANNQPENIPITTDVATYTASDPETDDAEDLVWSLAGAAASDFNIGNQEGGTPGELTFKEMPDFEKPAATRNLYRVIVTVSDGKLKATRAMTVTVTDLPEDGEIALSSVQPKVAVELTASLMDPDGGVKDVTWQWYDGTIDEDDLTVNAIDGATSATYTPVGDDVGVTLSVRAAYTDSRGETFTTATAEAVVIINDDNRAPVFRAGGVATGKEITSDTRSVPENSGADTNIGDPVVATDPNLVDNLTYMLSGIDAALFEILTVEDAGTPGTDERGQIQVKAGTKLNYEAKNTYMVTVTATDPNGLSDSIDVTIMVTDVDEAPEIIVGGLAITGLSAVSYAENGTGNVATYMAAGPDADMATWTLSGDDAGDFMISGGMLTFSSSPDYENPMDMDMDNMYQVTVKAEAGGEMDMMDVTVTVTNVDELGMLVGQDSVGYMEDDTVAVGTYTADGPVTPTWSVEGDDMEAFTIGGSSGELMFASPPDFEAPADMGMDNVYQVTVKAEAGGEMDMMEVTVTVTNEEETGEVTLWAGTDALTMAPQVGDTITGAVMDPDGGVMDESWQWSRTMTPDMMDSWMDIDAATDAAYMVAAGDTGYYLRVMATYTDAAGTDMAMEYSMPTMMVTMNAAPMFDSETGTREVAENTAAGENVGAPVTAMDADNDTLTYSLGGTDMASFDIDPATGQLMTKADLDYEMPRGMAMSDTNTNTYMVTVTAADPDGASDSIMVTIMVTDVDENVAPMFAADTATRMVAENTAAGMSVGAPVMATDANGDTLAYTLGGTDAASFDIGGSTGQLMTKADLDYEMPRGMAMSETNTNTYMVTVTATDPDGLSASIGVTITVTDVDEEVVGDTLVARYDANNNGTIEKSEVITAINDYLFGEGDAAITKPEVIELINLYLFG